MLRNQGILCGFLVHKHSGKRILVHFRSNYYVNGAERVVNAFGRSPTKSYSDLLGGMRSVCFGSVCFGSGPLKFSSRSALFWSIGFGFLKLFAPAAWSTHKGTFDCALLDWERALDRRAEFAPLRPRVDDDCARCLLQVTG